MRFKEFINEGKISKEDKKVLDYVKKEQNKKSNQPLIIYGVNAKDIIKMIEKPNETHKWKNDHFNKVENAVDKIYKKIK